MQRNIYIERERETILEIGQKYKDKNIIGHITFIILRETILEIGQKYKDKNIVGHITFIISLK